MQAARVSRASVVLESEITAVTNNRKLTKQMEAENGETLFLDTDSVASSEETSPSVWSRDYFGLMCSYWIVGTFEGYKGILYPWLIINVGKSGTYYGSAFALITIFWNFKFFYGFASDFIPIMGIKRKPYIVIGHGLSILFGFLIFFLFDSVRYDAILYLMAVQNFCSVAADVNGDGYTCYLAKKEHPSIRGRIQSWNYFWRFTANIVAFMMVGLCLNSSPYHGNFDWDLPIKWVLFVYACLAAAAYPFTIFMLKPQYISEEGKANGFAIGDHLFEARDLLLTRPVYQFVGFILIYNTLSGSTNYVQQSYQNTIEISPLQNSLNLAFQNILLLAGIWLVKNYLLQASWRKMFIATCILQVILVSCPLLFVWAVINTNSSYASWLWTFLTATSQLPYGCSFFISTLCVVELAKPGQEGLTYSILTSVGNLTIPLSTIISNQLAAIWPNLVVEDLVVDTSFKKNYTYLQVIISCLNLVALFALVLFPNQKAAAQELLKKPSSKSIGRFMFAITVLVFLYSTTGIILSTVPSTSCLAAFGGSGC
eukprot:Nk52_evm8s32 gene=Nk52_evmTU8s32